MTTLVTGATGLLGSHITDLLVARGERPRVLVRPNEGMNHLTATHADVLWGDLADGIAIQSAVQGVDCVLHCAARTGPWGDEAEYTRTNVHGLKTLLDAAIAAGVRRIVHVSSVTVHGNDVGGVADETAPFRPEPNPYSRSKIAGEALIQRMIRERQAPVVVVRPGLIYGPRDAASFARFATMILQRRMIVVGSGDNRLPLIYVGDAAEGILLARAAERVVGKAYLLVSDEPVSQWNYLSAIAAELGVPAPKIHIPYRLAVAVAAAAERVARIAHLRQGPPITRFGVQVLGGNNRFLIDRARADLGFAPSVNLAEGVRRGVSWYRTGLGVAREGVQAA